MFGGEFSEGFIKKQNIINQSCTKKQNFLIKKYSFKHEFYMHRELGCMTINN